MSTSYLIKPAQLIKTRLPRVHFVTRKRRLVATGCVRIWIRKDKHFKKNQLDLGFLKKEITKIKINI